MTDLQLAPIASLLLSCLCDAVDANPDPPLRRSLRVGTEIAYDLGLVEDLCCQGLAYVSVGPGVVSGVASFPDEDQVRQAARPCPPPSWGYALMAGIIRCVPVGDINAGPTDAQWTQAALRDMDDAQALRAAACSFRDQLPLLPLMVGYSVTIDRQEVTEPSGGCVERSQLFTVQIPYRECGSC